jgi:alpha-beta hydrolase superfamily lysophospholipase
MGSHPSDSLSRSDRHAEGHRSRHRSGSSRAGRWPISLLGAAAAVSLLLVACGAPTQPGHAVAAKPSPPSRALSTEAASTTSSTSPTIAAPAIPEQRSGPPWGVARAVRVYTDLTRATPARGPVPMHRGRVLRTTVLWPITPDGHLAPGPHPLMIFAHGYATSVSTYTVMLEDLAAAGIIIAAPELPGESSALPGTPLQADLINEPCDLEFIAASIKRAPPAALAHAITSAPLILAGHSDGATAAATAAYASPCPGVSIDAVVAIAPDDVPISTTGTLAAHVPLLAIAGTADSITPDSHTTALWAHVPAPAWLLTIDGSTHFETVTTDPERRRIAAVIADFVFAKTEHNSAAWLQFSADPGDHIQLRSR